MSATAPGYAKRFKRVRIPAGMRRAGRVDFELRKAAPDPQQEVATAVATVVAAAGDEGGYKAQDDWERFDPYNHSARYTVAAWRQEQRTEKPWWFSFFVGSGGGASPTWLLRKDD